MNHNQETTTVAFRMRLKAGFGEEYRKRHELIWPEVVALLRRSGVVEYHIYLDEETNLLFAFQRRAKKATAQTLDPDPIMRRWWDHMSDIMEVNPDNSPVWVPCQEMFSL